MPTQRLLGRNLLWRIWHIFDSLWSAMEYKNYTKVHKVQEKVLTK